MTEYKSIQGDTLDKICFRFYGYTKGILEQTLEANPGVEEFGPELPLGTLISLPEVAPPAGEEQSVRLWD